MQVLSIRGRWQVMGLRGPKPKPRDQVRQPGRTQPPEVLPAPVSDRQLRRLPRRYSIEGADGAMRSVEYLPETREWWRGHASGAMAPKFLPTDWQRLELVARLVDSYFRHPKHTIMAEIRLCEQQWGATIADRIRLNVKVMSPPNAATSAAVPIPTDKVAVMDKYRRATESGTV